MSGQVGIDNIVINGLSLYLDASNKKSYPGSNSTWYDLSGNGRNFNWYSTPSFVSDGYKSYFSTLGNICKGPASNSFGITNTSGYTIFLILMQNSLVDSSAFKFYSSNTPTNRGIFAHCTWSDNNIYFDQGGCCNSNTRTLVASGGVTNWSIITFRRLSNSSTRTISKNGITLVTNTDTALDINLNTTVVDLGGTNESTAWNARLNSFIVYNRGLSDTEITQNFTALRGRFGI